MYTAKQNRQSHSGFATALVAVGGVTVGVLLALILTSLVSPHPRTVASASEVQEAARIESPAVMAQVERSMEWQKSAASSPAPVGAESGRERVENVPSSPAENQARFDQLHRDRLAKHSAEARDPGWAAKAEQSIGESLKSASRTGEFEIQGIDCRTSSCVAKLGWNNFRKAASSMRTLLFTDLGMNCGTAVNLPPPVDAKLAYNSEVVFDNCRFDGAGETRPPGW